MVLVHKDESVPDSEDDEWLQPWSSPGNAGALPEDVGPTDRALGRADGRDERSASPDELAVNFDSFANLRNRHTEPQRIVETLEQLNTAGEGTILQDRVHNVLAPQKVDSVDGITELDVATGEPMDDVQAESTEAQDTDLSSHSHPEESGELMSLPASSPGGMASDDQTQHILTEVHITPARQDRTESPASTITPIPGGRVLRPRTYQQLHTYEYEHAKYVMECRAAGIKPVRFDGGRYRETDTTDKDFVPPPERSLQTPQASTQAQAERGDASPPRKRKKSFSRFKDPRQLDPSNVETAASTSDHVSDAHSDIFDFPDEHWQARRDIFSQPGTPDSVQSLPRATTRPRLTSDRQVLTVPSESDEESDNSVESEAAARLRFARRLKGVLPPSYLSRQQSTPTIEKRPNAPRINKSLVLNQSPFTSKGVGRKKFGSSTTIPSASRPGWTEVSDEESQSRLPIPVIRTISEHSAPISDIFRHDYDDDIVEAEEPIDYMLPAVKRIRNGQGSNKRQKSNHKSTKAQDIHLVDVVKAQNSSSSKELRLAARTVRKKGTGGTQLARKYINIHKGLPRLKNKDYKASESRNDSTDESIDVPLMLVQWSRNKLPISGQNVNRPRPPMPHHAPSESSSSPMSERVRDEGIKSRDPPSKARLYEAAQGRSHKTGQAYSNARPRVRSAKSGKTIVKSRQPTITSYFLDNDEDGISPVVRQADQGQNNDVALESALTNTEGLPVIPTPHVSSYAGANLHNRMFSANIEHESGTYALQVSRRPVRKAKSNYLQRFDRITNIFGEEPDQVAKVSQWQLSELPKAIASRRFVETAQVASQANVGQGRSKRKRKGIARRVIAKQKSILGFTHKPEALCTTRTTFNISDIVVDVSLGSEVAVPGTYFAQNTFVGSGGLLRVLQGSLAGRTTCCYLGNRLLSIETDSIATTEYVTTALSQMVDDVINFQVISDDHMLSVYAAMRMVVEDRQSQISTSKFVQDVVKKQISKLAVVENRSSQTMKVSIWLRLFLIILVTQASPAQMTALTSNAELEEVLKESISYLLGLGFDTLASTIRRHHNSTNRMNGLTSSTSDSLVELWVTIYHIANSTRQPFWARILPALELEAEFNQSVAERAWYTLSNLSAITQFDLQGQAKSGAEPTWATVELLLQPLNGYVPDKVNPSSTYDRYVNILLQRIHRFITTLTWSNADQILGERRSGGALHTFFFHTLNLGNLLSEDSLARFPDFFTKLDNPQCLQYDGTPSDNAFSTFLHIVCLGIKQAIQRIVISKEDTTLAKRRGIAVVDKFGTHGRLAYLASEAISRRTVNEVSNRFALEIAVYWVAAEWKDRGISKIVQAAIDAMSGSHLALREINIKAFEIVAQLQICRGEDEALELTMTWLKSIIQANISDVLQFRHQSRLNTTDAKLQRQLILNLEACGSNLMQCYSAYHRVLELPLSTSTPRRTCVLWLNDVLRPVLQLHESFLKIGEKNLIVEEVLRLARLLLDRSVQHSTEQDSQDYDFMDASQGDVGVIDFNQSLQDNIHGLTALLFQFLSNVAGAEKISSTRKVLARTAIDAFSQAVICLHRRQTLHWQELFDQRGVYSWSRLLDTQFKAVIQPYFLAVLCDKAPGFFSEMTFTIVSTWLNTMTRFDIGDSMASLTTVLLQKDMIFLRDQRHVTTTELSTTRISATTFKTIRTPLLLHAIKQLAHFHDRGLLADDMTANYLSGLILTMKSTYQDLAKTGSSTKLLYVKFIHEVLATTFQFCQSILRLLTLQQRSSIDWLCDSHNVPQVRDDFTAETFRSYSTADLNKKGREIALNLSARCDAELLDSTQGLAISLRAALNNNPLRLETSPQWDHDVASLRRFVIIDVIGCFLRLSSTHTASSLYLAILLPAMQGLYLDILEQSWCGDQHYIKAFFSEVNSVIKTLEGYEQVAGLCTILRDILRLLSKYSWLEAADHVRSHTSSNSSSPSDDPPSAQRAIFTVLRDNVLSNWTPTQDGYFHTRRRTTIPKPSNLPQNNEIHQPISCSLQRQRSMDDTFEPAYDFLDLSTVHI